jgi:hypothetical protein
MTQISPFGPSARTSTRNPRVGTNSSTEEKPWLERCRHTPRAKSWPGIKSVCICAVDCISHEYEQYVNKINPRLRVAVALSAHYLHKGRDTALRVYGNIPVAINVPRELALVRSWSDYLAPTCIYRSSGMRSPHGCCGFRHPQLVPRSVKHQKGHASLSLFGGAAGPLSAHLKPVWMCLVCHVVQYGIHKGSFIAVG